MPNHVHLIAVPHSADGLKRAIGEIHRRYTRMVNFREGWRGHLWQGRFASFVLDEPYLLTAARYIELNPVRGADRGAEPLPVGQRLSPVINVASAIPANDTVGDISCRRCSVSLSFWKG